MILLDFVTENVPSEPFLEIPLVGLFVVKGDLVNVLCHENDKVIPFFVNQCLKLEKVLQQGLYESGFSILINRTIVCEYRQAIEYREYFRVGGNLYKPILDHIRQI